MMTFKLLASSGGSSYHVSTCCQSSWNSSLQPPHHLTTLFRCNQSPPLFVVTLCKEDATCLLDCVQSGALFLLLPRLLTLGSSCQRQDEDVVIGRCRLAVGSIQGVVASFPERPKEQRLRVNFEGHIEQVLLPSPMMISVNSSKQFSALCLPYLPVRGCGICVCLLASLLLTRCIHTNDSCLTATNTTTITTTTNTTTTATTTTTIHTHK